jgi:ribosome modulation factor
MFGISIDIRKLDPVINYLKSIPRGTVKVALPAMAEWFIGNGQRGLRRYSPYRYVSRARAYPDMSFTTKDGRRIVGYKSLKQFQLVMARVREGRIDPGVPHRTGNAQRGYVMSTTNRGYTVKIQNRTRGAVYTRHNVLQARLNLLAGWRKARAVIESNMDGALRHARAKVRAYLKGKGKSS